jgi:hypothetical protein
MQTGMDDLAEVLQVKAFLCSTLCDPDPNDIALADVLNT